MDMRVAAIIVGLIAAGAPALAKESHIRKPAAAAAVPGAVHRAAVKKPAVKKSHIAATAAAHVEQTGSVRHRKGAKAKRDKDSDSDILATLERGSLAAAANFPGEAVGWRLIEDPATGAYIGLPEKLVPHAGASRTGSRWTSAQGQIQIETFRLTEAALPALFDEEKKASRRQVASSALKPDSFAIVGIQGLKNFVVRADARGSEVRGVSILYDQATEGIMGRVAIAIAHAFSGFPDPNGVPPPGMRRMVEYSTAIVVSSGGDLLAPGHVTDECQAITVPGLGHAERVAEDKTNDLALIRLYGARNLVPATLAGDGGQGGQGAEGGQAGELTLVGVADPLAQAGDNAVTSAAARLTAQGVEPAPKPGFSGAAALDASGRFAGMVDLKPSIIAGSGSAGREATLVPAAAIRAFLQARGIALAVPAAGHAAMDQSVVRVICVRK